MGLGGVTVRISGMGDGQTATDDSGQYSFTGLRAGTYSVEISGFDTNEVSFSSTSGAATVGVGESKVVSFDGTYLRTAGIQGQVTVDGEGLGGVTVTLVGEGEDRTETTNASGQYAFSQLKSGTYQVAITNPDPDDYEFATTSKSATIATGEVANVPFEGTLLRTAGIAGRVSVEGMGLNDVTVNLAGAEERTTTTSDGGQYSFAGLAAGTYVVSITNPDEVAYNFAEEDLTENVTLADDQSAIVNFSGTHTRTASVTGLLYIDEGPNDGMYTANEPPLVNPDPMAPGMPLLLQGPGINDVTPGAANADGTFAFEGLMAGSYRVLVNMTDEVAAGLAAAGFSFDGDLTGAVVHVAAGMAEQVNFPFRITTQTITVGAVMGDEETVGDAVNGVMLSLYPTAEDAEDGTNMLAEAMATAGEGPIAGMAKFDFPRAMDSRPGSDETDNLVFVKVDDTGSDQLVVTANNVIEIEYPGIARAHAAPAHVRLLNSAVNIQFWIKSDEDAKDGNMGLEGWAYEYCMPMADDPATMDVDEANTCMDAEDGTPAVFTAAEDADGEAMLTDADGKGTLSFMADTDNLPAMVYIRAAADQDDEIDMGEMYEQTDALMHEHDGFILPANNDPAENMDLDKGPVYVSFTTQSLFIGAHRELDDRTGLTDNIGVGGGDKFPTGDAVDKIEVRLMQEDARGRLRPFEYDHDLDAETPDVAAEAMFGDDGQVKFAHVPANAKITVEVDAGSGMTIIPNDRDWRVIDAYTDVDYPAAFGDGVIVGGFGEGAGGGGARPDVWLCPLQRQDGTDNCSTFGYKWADGTISGSIGGLRRGDEDVVVTLTPVNSNEEYSADLEDDTKVSAASPGFRFASVADGRYKVKLEGVAGKWSADSVMVTVVHDELEPNERGSASVAIDSDELTATSLRLAIQGVVANDRDSNGTVSSTETEDGVVLELFKASVPRTGANAGKAVKGAAVVDADGNPVTATTDRDGIYAFTGLVEGQKYIVEAVNVPGSYKAVRKRGSLAIKADDFGMVSQAYVSAASNFNPNFTGGTPPEWDHARNFFHNAGTANFALLWDDGTAFGKVSDPSVRGAHAEATIELFRCQTDGAVAARDRNGDGDTTDDGEAAVTDDNSYMCNTEPAGRRAPFATATPNARGDWEIEGGLLEGNYVVTVDLPRSYAHSDEDGAAGTAPTTGDPTNGYVETQIAEITDGRGSDDGTLTFHIVLSGADNAAPTVAPTVRIKDGSRTVGVVSGGTASTSHVAYTTGSVEATLGHGTGAATGTTYKVVYSATSKVPFAVGAAGTWRGLRAGTNTLTVEATAPSGYADANFTPRTLHRDRDTRLKVLEIELPGGAGTNVVIDRDALEAISGFPAAEGRRTDELDPANTSGGTTTVDLGILATVERPAAGGTAFDVNFQASANGAGVTLTGNTAQSMTPVPSATSTAHLDLTFTITLTDSGRDGTQTPDIGTNSRTYTFKVRGTSPN
ncbi:MAG: carboxypeptidase regulatory-like domain-containing protein [Gemmatimonadota bacterium]|nr:carboxypeptidase regulatory-like domain-containing protein [Gemmatimonadota bacterium]